MSMRETNGRPHRGQSGAFHGTSRARQERQMGIRPALSRILPHRPQGAGKRMEVSPPASSHRCAPSARPESRRALQSPDAMRRRLAHEAPDPKEAFVIRFFWKGISGKCRFQTSPCSCFSWQVVQCRAQGTASSRFCCRLRFADFAVTVGILPDAFERFGRSVTAWYGRCCSGRKEIPWCRNWRPCRRGIHRGIVICSSATPLRCARCF